MRRFLMAVLAAAIALSAAPADTAEAKGKGCTITTGAGVTHANACK